jgi:alkylation response protein AidB-like acyl-CoA dehydrogenase
VPAGEHASSATDRSSDCIDDDTSAHLGILADYLMVCQISEVDFSLTDAEEAFRAEAAAWLAANVPAASSLASLDTEEGFEQHRSFERSMFDDHWSVVSWPHAYGGRDVGIIEWLLFEQEYYRSGGPKRVSQNGIFLLAPTIFDYGTPEQRDRFLPPMASGEEIWCQGWSEPDAGSDLASLRSTATKVDGGWLLNGQKTWASRGAFAHWCFGLFRSDPEAERHRGLTYFLLSMDSPGVTRRPIAQLDGETGFAEIFFDDVFVPDDQVLGEVGQGWSVAMATAGSERGLSLRSPARYRVAAERLISLLIEREGPVSEPISRLTDRTARAYCNAAAYELQTWWTATAIREGHGVGPEASATKIFWSELDVDLHETALELLGPEAEILNEDASLSDWLDGYLFSIAGPIYAGTNQIQRNVVAERLLGLPRR